MTARDFQCHFFCPCRSVLLIISSSVLTLTGGQIVFPGSTSDLPEEPFRESGRSLRNCVTNEQKAGTCLPLTKCLVVYTQLTGLIQQVIVFLRITIVGYIHNIQSKSCSSASPPMGRCYTCSDCHFLFFFFNFYIHPLFIYQFFSYVYVCVVIETVFTGRQCLRCLLSGFPIRRRKWIDVRRHAALLRTARYPRSTAEPRWLPEVSQHWIAIKNSLMNGGK